MHYLELCDLSVGLNVFSRDRSKKGLALGVTMGSFDIQHTELLRTCSEPDLAGLFKTMSKESPAGRRHSLSDMSTVQEEVRLLMIYKPQ